MDWDEREASGGDGYVSLASPRWASRLTRPKLDLPGTLGASDAERARAAVWRAAALTQAVALDRAALVDGIGGAARRERRWWDAFVPAPRGRGR